MKKLIFIVLGVVLVVIVLLAPWTMGYLAEKKIKQLVLDFKGQSRVDIEIQNYQRHWFSSDAELIISYSPTYSPISDKPFLKFTSNLHVLHGPIILSRDKDKNMQINFAQALLKFQIDANESGKHWGDFDWPWLINYDGKIDSLLKAKVNYKDPNGALSIDIPQINGQIRLASGLNKAIVDIKIPHIQIADMKGSSIQFANLSIGLSNKKDKNNLWFGQANFHVDNLLAQMKNENPIKVDNIDLNTEEKEDHESMVGNLKLKIQTVSYANKNYGPHILEFHEKFDLELYKKVKKAMQLYRKSMELANKQDVEGAQQQFQQLILEVLNKGFDLSIDKLQILTGKGNVDATALFKLEPQVSSLPPPFSAADMYNIINHFNIKIRFNIGKPLLADLVKELQQSDRHSSDSASQLTTVKSPQQQIDELITEGILVSKNNDYELIFNFSKDAINLNGQSFANFSELLQKIIPLINPNVLSPASVPTTTPIPQTEPTQPMSDPSFSLSNEGDSFHEQDSLQVHN